MTGMVSRARPEGRARERMQVKRVQNPETIDAAVRGVLDAMSDSERHSYLEEFRAGCEARIRTIEQEVETEEIKKKRTAVQLWARSQIFEKPELIELTHIVTSAESQIESYRAEIGDFRSLILLCNDELGIEINRSSRN